jgi:predicted alpha/beta-fold hydrolase
MTFAEAPAVAEDVGLPPFVPMRRLSNGHAMTIFAWVRSRQFPALPAPEPRLMRVSDDTQVLAHCYWQPHRAQRPTLLAMHGLEGSSGVHYMRGLADKAWRRGWNAVLLNQRNCGGTEQLTPGLYHSGLTSDPREVMRQLAKSEHLTRFGVVGYSLGGNLSLKLAGELQGDREVPVRAAVAVCPILEIGECVHALERRSNSIYQFNFLRNLKSRMRRKDKAWPGAFDISQLARIWSIRAFDDAYTAPFWGYGDAANYYYQVSAMRVIDRIDIPALILAAKDDPFVPSAQFLEDGVRNSRHVRVLLSEHGGHCGFVSAPSVTDDGYWAESTAIAFLAAHLD